MEVWLVYGSDFDDRWVVGVYSSEEFADEAIEKFKAEDEDEFYTYYTIKQKVIK